MGAKITLLAHGQKNFEVLYEKTFDLGAVG